MNIYISGKITGEMPFRCTYRFGYAATKLKNEGHKVINPLEMLRGLDIQGFTYEELMTICFAALSICDAIYMLEDWSESKGAKLEHQYALDKGKQVIYQEAENVNKM